MDLFFDGTVLELEQAVPVEWLPREVLALVFSFVDAKTLMITIPAVSGVGGQSCWGEVIGCVPVLPTTPPTPSHRRSSR